MKSFLRATCLLTLAYVQPTWAQDMTSLFERWIPASALRSELQRENVNLSLEAYARISPEIIYFYLTNLQLRFERKIGDKDSNFTNALTIILRQNRSASTLWAKAQIDSALRRIDDRLWRNDVISRLSEFVFEPVPADTVHMAALVDTNLVEFFEYVFLARAANQTYDRSIPYGQLCKKELERIIAAFRQGFEAVGEIEDNHREALLESALNYPFIFRSEYLLEHNVAFPLQMYEFIARCVEDEYRPKNTYTMNAAISYVARSYHGTYRMSDPFFPRGYSKDFTFNFPVALRTYLGTLIPTRMNMGFLSHVRVITGVSVSISTQEDLGGTLIYQGSRAIPGGLFSGRYYLSDLKDGHTYSIFAELTTPVVFLFKTVYVETGGGYAVRRTSLTYNLVREGTVSLATPLGSLGPSERFELTTDDSSLYGLVCVIIDFTPHLSLTTEYVIAQAPSIGVRYSLRL